MAHKTVPLRDQLAADQRIWHLGYSHGYKDGHTDGHREGEEVFLPWLVEELATLAQDVRLGLKDLPTPLAVIAEILALVQEGQPPPRPAGGDDHEP